MGFPATTGLYVLSWSLLPRSSALKLCATISHDGPLLTRRIDTQMRPHVIPEVGNDGDGTC